MFEYFANLFAFLSVEVNNANSMIIAHCPSANENKRELEKSILPEIVATAIILANIGEEQGLDANAKNVPTKNG